MRLITAFYLKIDPYTEKLLGSSLFCIDTDISVVMQKITAHRPQLFRRYCITIEDVDMAEVIRRLEAYGTK